MCTSTPTTNAAAWPACAHYVNRSHRWGRFDALLQMQVAFRANVLSAFVPARRRIGYDRNRSKDLHGLFVNERIADHPGIHVLDAIGSFAEPLGLRQTQVRWDLPVPEEAHAWARAQWDDDGRPVLMISPCSSHARRNWYADRHAALADHAAAQGLADRAVRRPQRPGAQHCRCHRCGRTHAGAGLGWQGHPQATACPARACGPGGHPGFRANAHRQRDGHQVLGLHAASNPSRSGPYSDVRYCVDRYDAAARKFLHKPADRLRWGTKIEFDDVMSLITVDDAIAAFERYRADHPR